ncbi:MAG: hypothetical protein Q9190_000558 [Brigantiaea leucoxantha]
MLTNTIKQLKKNICNGLRFQIHAFSMMDEYTAEALVNRDEPMPVIAVSGTNSPSPDPDSKRERLKASLSTSKLKEKLQDGTKSRSETGYSLQDRLLTKLLQQVMPSDNIEEALDLPPDKRSSKYINRPGFSLPLMTTNFRRFNASLSKDS